MCTLIGSFWNQNKFSGHIWHWLSNQCTCKGTEVQVPDTSRGTRNITSPHSERYWKGCWIVGLVKESLGRTRRSRYFPKYRSPIVPRLFLELRHRDFIRDWLGHLPQWTPVYLVWPRLNVMGWPGHICCLFFYSFNKYVDTKKF